MNRLKTVLFIMLIVIGNMVFSQGYNDYYKTPDNNVKSIKVDDDRLYENLCNDKRPFAEDKRLKANVQMGTSVGAINNSTLFTSYMSPSISYKATSKLSITVGATTMLSNVNNTLYGSSDTYSPMQNNFQSYLFAQGEYKINNKLTFRGSTMKEVSSIGNKNGFSMNHVGFDYKFSNNLQIGADISFSQGMNPYMYNNPYSSLNSYGMHPSMSFMPGMGRVW